MEITNVPIDQAMRARFATFIGSCGRQEHSFGLTPLADSSPYALCFAIYGYHLIGFQDDISDHKHDWYDSLRRNLDLIREHRAAQKDLTIDKPYLQLLTFTLSALKILGLLDKDPLEDHVVPLLPKDVDFALDHAGVYAGRERSGNQAMFLAILLIHARERLDIDCDNRIQTWVKRHLETVNKFGFWGPASSMSHLQFQNGYHQYEIFQYLGIKETPWSTAAAAIATLADSEGHFAPYPGGGGCFDYDAAFILTGNFESAYQYRPILKRLYGSLRSEVNSDGGFCESRRVRPRTPANLSRQLRHMLSGHGRARIERIRYGLSLLRPKHGRIDTHWSTYSRRWDESDLWDSWFRMLTLARVEVSLGWSAPSDWGFIDHVGIGYHPSLRAEKKVP